MVNFESVSLGLEVEFQLENEIYDGIVRFKGPVNGKDGVWVGLETIQEGDQTSNLMTLLQDIELSH